MSEINYHRITDWNGSIHSLDNHTNFEAGFSTSENALFLHGRIIDSNGIEVARSGDLREFLLQSCQNWNPTVELENMIEAIELQTIETEPVYFQAPMAGMTLEIKGPIANPKVFGTTIYMTGKFIFLGSYEWQDSGSICFRMLCKKDNLLEFARGLQSDLSMLLSNKGV
ncbi:MAG: hypothetical protein KME17_31030 [Cyanosarcina radialis HA8281-LM2]|jgi:hypothetical protein|nr:hypothetical protein [Cyanosarcina radialis HA8281-LM2]